MALFKHGFIVWGFFLIYAAVWAAYLVWMGRHNRVEQG